MIEEISMNIRLDIGKYISNDIINKHFSCHRDFLSIIISTFTANLYIDFCDMVEKQSQDSLISLKSSKKSI